MNTGSGWSVPSSVAQCSSGPLPLETHQIPGGLVSNSANKTFCTASPCASVIQYKGGQMFKLETVFFFVNVHIGSYVLKNMPKT